MGQTHPNARRRLLFVIPAVLFCAAAGLAAMFMFGSLRCSAKLGLAEHEDLLKLGHLHFNNQNYKEAEANYRSAVALARKLGPHHPALARSLNRVGLTCAAQGKTQAAQSCFEEALEIWKQSEGPDSLESATASFNLGYLLLTQDDPVEAEFHLQRALEIREASLPQVHQDVLEALDKLAWCYFLVDRNSEAVSLFRKALNGYEQTRGPRARKVAEILNNIGYALFEQGEHAEAQKEYRRALSIYEEVLPSHHPELARVLQNLAIVYLSQERYAEAEAFLQRALPIVEKCYGMESEPMTEALRRLEQALRGMDQDARADTIAARIRAIRANQEATPRRGPAHSNP